MDNKEMHNNAILTAATQLTRALTHPFPTTTSTIGDQQMIALRQLADIFMHRSAPIDKSAETLARVPRLSNPAPTANLLTPATIPLANNPPIVYTIPSNTEEDIYNHVNPPRYWTR